MSYSGIIWNIVNATTNISPNCGYISNQPGTINFYLPTQCNIGDMIYIATQGQSSIAEWTINQNAGQQIFSGASASTPGVSGGLYNNNQWDSVILVCVTANTQFAVLGGTGASTY